MFHFALKPGRIQLCTMLNFYPQILKPADKKKFPYGGLNSGRPVTPPRGGQQGKGKKK